ncbi:MAG: YheU family protein [Proteobacteria bacterium]|nr:YheU family protein [Pseudomonadota bacterium]
MSPEERSARPAAPEDPEPVAVPHAELSAQALRGVIESFVLREGTDYGEREFTLEQKIAHVRAQLDSGEAQIFFDPGSESIDIVRTRPR